MAARGQPHRARIEVRRLDEHVCRAGADLAVGCPHHPGDGHRAVRVAIGTRQYDTIRESLAVEAVQQFFGRQAVPVHLPIGEEKNFAGVVDVIEGKARLFEKDAFNDIAKQAAADLEAGLAS